MVESFQGVAGLTELSSAGKDAKTLVLVFFGEVHREELVDELSNNDKHTTTKSRAVKVLRRSQLERMKVDYKRELEVLIHMSQPRYVHRFVEFHAWYENNDNIFLAMEYVPGGDLGGHQEMDLGEDDVKSIGQQVLDGLSVLHHLDFIHRDIKPANIFVVSRNPLWWVKIGDFSICKSTLTHRTNLHTLVGTSGYQAPEILGLVETEKQHQYNAKCDIWSFGCLVYELLTGVLPFRDLGDLTRFCDQRQTFPNAESSDLPAASAPAIEFIQELLQARPRDRPTANEALVMAKNWYERTHITLHETSSLAFTGARVQQQSEVNLDSYMKQEEADKNLNRSRSSSKSMPDVRDNTLPLESSMVLETKETKHCEGGKLQHVPSAYSILDHDIMDIRQYSLRGDYRYYKTAGNGEPPPVLFFTDIHNRSYTFPWHICCKWQNMEHLVQQSSEFARAWFHSVELVDPLYQTILPENWEVSIIPGMQISTRWRSAAPSTPLSNRSSTPPLRSELPPVTWRVALAPPGKWVSGSQLSYPWHRPFKNSDITPASTCDAYPKRVVKPPPTPTGHSINKHVNKQMET